MNLVNLRSLKESILAESTQVSHSHDAIQNKENIPVSTEGFKKGDKVYVSTIKANAEIEEVDEKDEVVKVKILDGEQKEKVLNFASNMITK